MSPPACVITGIRGADTLPGWVRRPGEPGGGGAASHQTSAATLVYFLPCWSANCPRILNGPERGLVFDFSRGEGGGAVVDVKFVGKKKQSIHLLALE